MNIPEHVPVMSAEVVAALAPERGGVFVDCTLGLGGHTAAVLAAGATRVIGIDRDEEALAIARERLAQWQGQVDFVHADFRGLGDVLDSRGLPRVDGILADLGVSSLQFDGAGRGFSFQRDEPLDMRMDRSAGPTAADLIADLPEEELADVIYRYGEERFSRRIARVLVEARRGGAVATTGELAALVRRAIPTERVQPDSPGDAHVPGAADCREPGARRARPVRGSGVRAAGAARAPGRDCVSLARGSRRSSTRSAGWWPTVRGRCGCSRARRRGRPNRKCR